jgi:acyl-CoA synthetase (AMP-forming)/AMP-acid ligase II
MRVWTSPFEPIERDDATFHGLVAETARRHGDRIALLDAAGGARVPYATLAERVERVSALLAERGFGPGDVLALRAPNVPPWAGVALGAMAAGGAVTGVIPSATPAELATQLDDSGASLLVTAPGFEPAAAATIEIGEALLSARGPAPRPAADPDALAMLPYSSGTTGLPKGVMLTHRNLVAAVRQAAAGLRLTPRDVVLALAPFAHVMGFVITLGTALTAGARLVTMPRFELEAFLAAVEGHRVSVLIVPPPVMGFLARHPRIEAYDLSSVELIVSGGAPLGAELQSAVAERFPQAVVGQGYGLTETTGCAAVPDRERGTVPGSAGGVAPSTELRVADDGELLIRGPQTMAGYLHRSASELIDADGWVHSGDLGRIDADGSVFVLDRLKELIKVNALQVAPAELEALLATHPAVGDCAVIGRPDERRGEVPVAFVVPRGQVDEAELMAFVAARVAPHKRVREVRFVDAVPRTPAGKIRRRALRDTIGRHGRRPSAAEGRTAARGSQYV